MACGRTSSKADLVRFVRTAQGTVEVDPSGRAPGRGAYLCPEHACFERASKRRSLERALRTKMDEAALVRLGEEFDTLCLGHGDMQ